MSDWVRKSNLEDAFQEMHGIRPQVYYRYVDRNTYQIKLIKSGKEIILQDQMKNGLTRVATVEYNGTTHDKKCIYDAEVEATKIFKE